MSAGLLASAAFGAWHFAIPTMFRWYRYIPDAPRTLVVAIDWTNFFLSLLLLGVSALLLVLRREVLRRERAALAFYLFLAGVWAVRILVTVVYPWSYDLMFVAQVVAFGFVTALLAAPLPRLLARSSPTLSVSAARRWRASRRGDD
jgi:hypothetical protein